MSAKWEFCAEFLMFVEGRYSNDTDAGGETSWGITLPVLRELGVPEGDTDGDGDIDTLDVRNLSKEEALEIWRRLWWERYGYARIMNWTIAARVLAFSANAGARQAHVLIQRILNRMITARYIDAKLLTIDGVFGDKTAAAINAAPPWMFLRFFRQEMEWFYREIVKHHAKYKPYLTGWLNRAYY